MLPKLIDLRKEEKTKEKKRIKIPKSEYTNDGMPILMIPDLDDVNLTNEIDKYLGEKEE